MTTEEGLFIAGLIHSLEDQTLHLNNSKKSPVVGHILTVVITPSVDNTSYICAAMVLVGMEPVEVQFLQKKYFIWHDAAYHKSRYVLSRWKWLVLEHVHKATGSNLDGF